MGLALSNAMKRLLYLAPLLLLCACSSDTTDDDPNNVDPVTIEQGVAGTAYSVVWGPDDSLESWTPLPDVTITISSDDGMGGLTEISTLTTDADGFYELALEPGDYVISNPAEGGEHSFIVPAGAVKTCSFVTPSGLGPNWSCSDSNGAL